MTHDTRWMALALQAARKGFPSACPNPLVGCVLVKNGRLVSQGHHRQFGGAHAEINALKAARQRAQGATAYVTLEPCSHQGKTPPCTAALIQAGVKEVVYALKDPNPLVNGKGARILKAAGIEVTEGMLESEARAINLPFLSQMTRKRPYVVLKAAMTLDGKIADRKGDSRWITGAAARDWTHQARSKFDAILVGAGTVLKDDPNLTAHGQGRNPLRVILDPNLRTPLNFKVTHTDEAGTVIVTKNFDKEKTRAIAMRNIEILSVDYAHDRFDLHMLMDLLDYKGTQTLLVEGGGKTLASFLEAGLADELLWFVAPKILGGATAKTPVEGAGQRIAKAWGCHNLRAVNIGNDLLLRATTRPNQPLWSLLQRV